MLKRARQNLKSAGVAARFRCRKSPIQTDPAKRRRVFGPRMCRSGGMAYREGCATVGADCFSFPNRNENLASREAETFVVYRLHARRVVSP